MNPTSPTSEPDNVPPDPPSGSSEDTPPSTQPSDPASPQTPGPGQTVSPGGMASPAANTPATPGPSAFGVGSMQGQGSAQPVGSGQPVVSNTPPSPPARKSKKKLWLGLGVAGLVLLLGGGFVFGYYLPNRPSAVWNTGLDRTGEALTAFTRSATETGKLKKLDNYQLSGKLAVESGSQGTYSGTFASKGGLTDSDSSLRLTVKHDGKTADFDAKLLTKQQKDNKFPDIYLKLSGLSSLGTDNVMSYLTGIDGKWLFVSGDYLESVAENSASVSADNTKQLSKQEVADFAKAISSVAESYLLTSDPEKAVFEQRSYVGKESFGDVSTYHYTVGINVAHGKAFCQALGDAISGTAAYKKLITDTTSRQDRIKEIVNSCQDGFAETKPTDTFDLWIDRKYKLIYKVRIPDEGKTGSYVELGQRYQGGNKLDLFTNYHNPTEKQDMKLTLSLDLDNTRLSGDFKMTSDSDDHLVVTADFELKPYDGTITVTPPTKDIIDLRELFQSFESGDLSTTLQ